MLVLVVLAFGLAFFEAWLARPEREAPPKKSPDEGWVRAGVWIAFLTLALALVAFGFDHL